MGLYNARRLQYLWHDVNKRPGAHGHLNKHASGEQGPGSACRKFSVQGNAGKKSFISEKCSGGERRECGLQLLGEATSTHDAHSIEMLKTVAKAHGIRHDDRHCASREYNCLTCERPPRLEARRKGEHRCSCYERGKAMRAVKWR